MHLHTHSLVIPCASKSTQQSTVKAGLRLYNAWKWPFWSPLSHKNHFLKQLWLLWKMCPLFTENMPSASATLWHLYFSFLLNLTWFQFSNAPFGTVKFASCVGSNRLVVCIRTAMMFVHVCIFSIGRWGLGLPSPPFIFGGWLTGFGNGSVNTMSPVESLYFSLTRGGLAEIGTVPLHGHKEVH